MWRATVRPMATDRSELAGHLLGQPVEDWITDKRAAGRSWRQIAKDISDATAGRIRPTHETVRSWSLGNRQDAA